MRERAMSLNHKYRILKRLYDTGLKLTATDFSYISNANQYFVELENQDLITSEWGEKGDARVKLRYIAKHQKEKVKKYLESLQNAKLEQDEGEAC